MESPPEPMINVAVAAPTLMVPTPDVTAELPVCPIAMVVASTVPVSKLKVPLAPLPPLCVSSPRVTVPALMSTPLPLSERLPDVVPVPVDVRTAMVILARDVSSAFPVTPRIRRPAVDGAPAMNLTVPVFLPPTTLSVPTLTMFVPEPNWRPLLPLPPLETLFCRKLSVPAVTLLLTPARRNNPPNRLPEVALAMFIVPMLLL